MNYHFTVLMIELQYKIQLANINNIRFIFIPNSQVIITPVYTIFLINKKKF